LILVQCISFADVIYLKSGAKIEGIIGEESEDAVTIAIKIGNITYSREEIESISKSSAEENAKLKEGWKAQKQQQEAEEERRRKFAAEQEAKGLIFHDGQWITKDEYERLTRPEAEAEEEFVEEKEPKPAKPKERPKEEQKEPVKPVDTISFYDQETRYRYSYAVRLPKKYNPKTKYPVLFMFDPGANGEDAARRFAYAADKLGWIVVGSLDSRNGPWAPIIRAQEAMLRDVPKRFSVDEERLYAGGLSGGGRAAAVFAYKHPTQFKGLITCAFGIPGPKECKISKKVAVYICIGKDDFNLEAAGQDYKQLRTYGGEVYLHEFDGGHEWPPSEVVVEALNWMADKTK